MARLQAFLESQPDVGKTQSLVDLIKRMNQAMHGDDPAQYAIPETRDLVAQYLFLYSLSGDPQDFDSLVDNDYQRATVWTFVKNDSTTSADILAKKARAIIDESFPPGVTVQMGGSLPQLIALNDVIVKDKVRNMAQMAVVVFVLGAIILRSLRRRPVRGDAALRGHARQLRPDGLAQHAARHHGDDDGGDGDRHRRRLRDLPAVPVQGGAGAHRQRARGDAQRRC